MTPGPTDFGLGFLLLGLLLDVQDLAGLSLPGVDAEPVVLPVPASWRVGGARKLQPAMSTCRT